MKQWKKWMCMTAALTVFAAGLSGCGEKADSGGGLTASGDSPYLASEKPVTLTTYWMDYGRVIDTASTPILQEAARQTNVTLESALSSSTTDIDQAVSLAMASGDLPDLIQAYSRDSILNYGREGAYIDLTELIGQYAPNLKQFLEENPKVSKALKSPDGKIYYVPFIPDGDVSQGWMIRQDWLEKLNLKMPQTVEEFQQVLQAFKDQDPNGNGQQDEIPYFCGNANVGDDSSIRPLYGLFNTSRDWIEDETGNLVFGPYTQQYKDATKQIAKWYQDGLIDIEIFSRGGKARDILFGQNQGGVTYGWFGSTSQFNDTMKDQVPGFEVQAMAPPNGRVYDRRPIINEGGVCITASCKNPEAAVRFIDYFFTEEGRRLANFGIEGDSYTMVDGKPVFTDKVLHADRPVTTVLTEDYGAQLTFFYHQDFEYEKQWLNQTALAAMELYRANDYSQFAYQPFTRDEQQQKRFEEIMEPIKVYVSEMQQQWILGSQDVDATFDGFLQTLKQMNIEEAIEINQAAYRSYTK